MICHITLGNLEYGDLCAHATLIGPYLCQDFLTTPTEETRVCFQVSSPTLHLSKSLALHHWPLAGRFWLVDDQRDICYQ